jgi:uncharacterized protein (TIGR03086 family)
MVCAEVGLALLQRAGGFAVARAGEVTPRQLVNPTPCQGWDLRALLAHINESTQVLREAISSGQVGRVASHLAGRADIGSPRDTDPATAFRAEAVLLLGACASCRAEQQVTIDDRSLTIGLVAVTGAVELAVHGWDISAACGRPRPIPPLLATDLLEVAPLVVNGFTRPGLFGEPVRTRPSARPGDRLVALLGRSPAS